jgi:CHAT domain-containing protein
MMRMVASILSPASPGVRTGLKLTGCGLALLLACLLVANTASAQLMPDRVRLLTSGRYADLEKLVEKEIAGEPKPNSAKLMPLCYAYGKLKRYNKLFPCLERLDANVKAGDTAANDLQEMDRGNPLFGGLARLGSIFMGGEEVLKGSVVPYMHLLRAEALTELQQYDQAIAAAIEALEAMKKVPTPFEDRGSKVLGMAALGVAQALGGQRDAAGKTVAALRDIGTAYPYTGVKQSKWLGVVRVHAALGDFKAAHQVFRDEDPTSHGLFMSFAYGVGGAVAGLRTDESFTTWVDLPLAFLKHKSQMEVGELKPAKEGFDALLAKPETRDNGEIYWLLLYDRGRIAAAEGDLPGAIEFWRRAVEVIELQRSTINTEASKIGFVGDKQAAYRALVGGLFAQGLHGEAFEFVERSKARALVDLLAAKKDFAVAAPNAEEIRRLLASAAQEEADARAQSGATALRAAPAAMRALKEQAPELGSLVSVSATPLTEIQARVEADEALIEYYYDDASLYVFVLDRDGLKSAKLDAAGLERDVRALRKALELPEGNEHEELGRRLYAQLILPVEPLLAGKKALVIVPHGALHYLPFAALRGETGYLIDAYALRFLPSASVVRYLRSGSSPGRAGILAFGNPDLDDPQMDLKFAHQEALAVVQKVPQSRALLRKEASETALRQYAAGFAFLHFATHGEFNADAPLDSALLLAKDERADGLLTVGKLYAMRFDADLVTLSACETGLGKVASGDDVVGLTRGFLYAGASTIVASLWKVDDLATSTLMTRFYDELKSGERRSALRSAQLATRAEFPHPFFWAAFQLTGNAR